MQGCEVEEHDTCFSCKHVGRIGTYLFLLCLLLVTYSSSLSPGPAHIGPDPFRFNFRAQSNSRASQIRTCSFSPKSVFDVIQTVKTNLA